MPKIFFGIANHTLWIEVGGRGLDSGYVYGESSLVLPLAIMVGIHLKGDVRSPLLDKVEGRHSVL